MGVYLYLDIVDDTLTTPNIPFTAIEIDFELETVNAWGKYISFSNSWFQQNSNNGNDQWDTSVIDLVKKNGISQVNITDFVLPNERAVFRIETKNTVNNAIGFCYNIFSPSSNQRSSGKMFNIKVYNGASLVAHYDISTGTVQDQSGNGNHATLVGGTWVEDGEGGGTEPEPITHTLTLSETVSLSETMSKKVSRFKTLNDSIATSDTISKRLSVMVADTIETSENENENVNKSVNDSIIITDGSISYTQGKAINLSDSIAILDSITKSLTRSISDSVALADAEDETVLKSLVDNIALSDSLSTFGGKSILLTDAITVTDSISTTKRLSKFLTESISISDSFAKQSAQSIRLYDVIVTDDSINVFNPDAPTLIGVIRLKGKRELFVYLKGELNMLTNQNFSMVSGDTKTLEIDINENLIGTSVKWAMKKRGAPTITLNKNGSIVDGKIQIILDANDTDELSGLFVHECEITDQSGNVSTVTTGSVNILADMI